VAALGAVVLAGRSAGLVLVLASAAALSGWALLRIEVLFEPVLPTELPWALDRTAVATALGASAGAAIIAVIRAAQNLPDLEDVQAPSATEA
jgi:hypothetical protein